MAFQDVITSLSDLRQLCRRFYKVQFDSYKLDEAMGWSEVSMANQIVQELFAQARCAAVTHFENRSTAPHQVILQQGQEIMELCDCFVYDEEQEPFITMSASNFSISLYSVDRVSPVYHFASIGVIPRPAIRVSTLDHDLFLSDVTDLLAWLERHGFHAFLKSFHYVFEEDPIENAIFDNWCAHLPQVLLPYLNDLHNDFENKLSQMKQDLLTEYGSSKNAILRLFECHSLHLEYWNQFPASEIYIGDLIRSFSREELSDAICSGTLTVQQKGGLARYLCVHPFSGYVKYAMFFFGYIPLFVEESVKQELREFAMTLDDKPQRQFLEVLDQLAKPGQSVSRCRHK